MADDADARSVTALLRDLADGSGDLVRSEVRLARTEAIELVRAVGVGSATVATGGVLALLGALTVFAGLILLIGDQWLRENYWLAALFVTLIAGVATGLSAWRGFRLLSLARLAPNETVATLKEDVEWLKRQRT